ncbi:nitroreductase family protein [Almyronema epifaneia]|uniref:Nitroreductase family protein n=1 Tax=Almyronema epifaneia S1 TaxID=2991925 RepID=A0ABW6II78_9CYAN
MLKKVIKNSVPDELLYFAKSATKKINIFWLKIFTQNRALSSLFFLSEKAFIREKNAVLKGRLNYLLGDQNHLLNRSLLRRNVHRLEKGLLMKPRKSIFATAYICETVTAFKNNLECSSQIEERKSELKWAYDVLTDYFSVVESQPQIDKSKEIFRSLKPKAENILKSSLETKERAVPYLRNLNTPASVSYEDFLSLTIRRRSVRWYLPRSVPRDLIDKALIAASFSPSACNRQPFKFRIFDQAEYVSQVASLPVGTNGFSQNFPAIVVIVGQLRHFLSSRDRHVIYIDASLAAMSFMLALETLGLSSCPINWPDVESREKKMEKLLNLEEDERVIMLIAVGYPDPNGMVAFSQKKSLQDLRTYN